MKNRINPQYVEHWLDNLRSQGIEVDNRGQLALRLIVPVPVSHKNTNRDGETEIKRKAIYFFRPRRYLPAPRILERVRQCFNWPTCNTLVRRYFPMYPHVVWWEKAYTRMITTAKYYTWGYLRRCLETVKHRWYKSVTERPSSSGRPGRRNRAHPLSRLFATRPSVSDRKGRYEGLVYS